MFALLHTYLLPFLPQRRRIVCMQYCSSLSLSTFKMIHPRHVLGLGALGSRLRLITTVMYPHCAFIDSIANRRIWREHTLRAAHSWQEKKKEKRRVFSFPFSRVVISRAHYSTVVGYILAPPPPPPLKRLSSSHLHVACVAHDVWHLPLAS